jgi:diguanylate cyclase (GGDEF)-like protein/PAS domain S-box-containing protein
VQDVTAARVAQESLRGANALLQAVFDHAPAGMLLRARDGRILQMNGTAAEHLGMPLSAVGDVCWQDQVDPTVSGQLGGGDAEILRTNAPVSVDLTVARPDGTSGFLHVIRYPVLDERGEVNAFGSFALDITDRKLAELALRAAEERFRSAFENAPIGMALSDLEGNYLQVNGALCEITGYTSEQLRATSVAAITHPDDAGGDRELFERLLADEIEHYSCEQRYVRCTGEVVWVSLYATVLRDRDGEPLQLLSQILDITERRMLETQLRHLADHDPLTGLLNRRGLEAALEQHVARVSRYGDHGALLLMDLDHFKTVNDTLGHSAGDELIISVAGLLARRMRASDTIARLGGDEFAILLPEGDEPAACQVAAKIVKDVRASTLQIDGRESARVTASVGVTLFHRGIGGSEEALVNADLAMYDAKEAGRDQVALYRADRHDQSKMKTRLQWFDRIRNAIQADRFVFHAQPIAELETGSVRQYELLLRMLDESGDLILPGAFLQIAERYDLVQALDRWVTARAIEILEQQAALGHLLTLEVNLSGKSLGDAELLELIERELRRSGIAPSSLIFEVTETVAVANIQIARRFADRITELGCRFALDDFGAGLDSFYYLKYLPFDYLKIDGELVTNCTRNRTDQLVIESLVSIARGLGKQTIAAFVEDRETELFLRRHEVDLAQGYHIGRPVPIAEALNGAGATGAAPLSGLQPSALATSSSAIASEEVAAGEGALRTQATPPATARRKSSTSEPSRSTA